MDTGFVRIEAEDPTSRLKQDFPDVFADLLERAYEDTPYLLYFAFGELLLERRDDVELWRRAFRFFNDIAEGTDVTHHEILQEALVPLWDSDLREVVRSGLRAAGRNLFAAVGHLEF